jgi:hypothetical protein
MHDATMAENGSPLSLTIVAAENSAAATFDLMGWSR